MVALAVLKVPVLYVLSELFRISFALPELGHVLWTSYFEDDGDVLARHYHAIVLATWKTMVCLLIFTAMIAVIFLSAEHTRVVYSHVVSVIVVIVAGRENVQTLNALSAKYERFETDQIRESIVWERDGFVDSGATMQHVGDILYAISLNFVKQLCLSIAFECFQSCTKNYLNYRISGFCFAVPTILTFIPSTYGILNATSVLLTLCPLCKMLSLNIYFTLVNICDNGSRNLSRHLTKDLGLQSLVVNEWKRLELPLVFRMFWATRAIESFLYLLADEKSANITTYNVIKYLTTEGCDTFISLWGLISCISYIFCRFEAFVQRVLLTNVEGDERTKIVCIIFFFSLALITELTGLEPDERLTQLFQNAYVVWSVVLNYIHSCCYSVLVVGFVPHNKGNIRAVMICVFMILFAVTMLTYMWSYHSLSRFLLLVSAINIQTVFKVFVSLVIHTLFVVDAHSFYSWLNLEDNVFYIQTFESMIACGLNTFILVVSIYGKWPVNFPNIVLVILLRFHFVNNISNKVKSEWILFVNRQSAVRKIESMPDAASEQLKENDGFCAICYEKLHTAKVTNCNHYFHGKCLQKWIYINNFCPICLRPLFNL